MIKLEFPLTISTKYGIKVTINNFENSSICSVPLTCTSHVLISFEGIQRKIHAVHNPSTQKPLNTVILSHLMYAIEQCGGLSDLEELVFLSEMGLFRYPF